MSFQVRIQDNADEVQDFINSEFQEAEVVLLDMTMNRISSRNYYVFHDETIHKIEIPRRLLRRSNDVAQALRIRHLADEMRRTIAFDTKFIITDQGIRVEPIQGSYSGMDYKTAKNFMENMAQSAP